MAKPLHRQLAHFATALQIVLVHSNHKHPVPTSFCGTFATKKHHTHKKMLEPNSTSVHQDHLPNPSRKRSNWRVAQFWTLGRTTRSWQALQSQTGTSTRYLQYRKQTDCSFTSTALRQSHRDKPRKTRSRPRWTRTSSRPSCARSSARTMPLHSPRKAFKRTRYR